MTHVVLHIGAHKSATTAIQRGLEKLAGVDRGLAYVGPIDRAGPDERSRPLADWIEFARRVRGHAHTRESMVSGLCRLIEAQGASERVVISDENILGAMPGVAQRFYPRAEAVRRVIDDLAARFPTSVLLQSRETSSFLESCRRFRLMQGAPASRLAFLEGFDLGSVSWSKLGETLFDGAAFAWRVLPLERLADPSRRAGTVEVLRFLAPSWDPAKTPLETANVSRGPLVRAALLAFNRAGEAPAMALRGRVAREMSRVEQEATSGAEEGVRKIQAALTRAGVETDAAFARLVHAQFLEEIAASGFLTGLLRERFSADYAAFLERYAAG